MKNARPFQTILSTDALNKIEQYDISFVFDKLCFDGKITAVEIPELETEFKKFIILVALNIQPIAMISPQVDEVWHQFILFTAQYRKFCLETVGFFIGHTPDTPKTPIPVEAGENFREAYKANFGDIPQIWYKGMDQESLKYYAQSHLIGRPPKLWSGWAGPEEL
ncbi:MAG: hypothetical protein JWQ34_2621 [Mucilaginibacter sp.]|uniref:glycine-rich domain-containing protein n=1 Tax=Mucilaginibacter sp. TaxID=1882438 RepID=UPI00261F6D8D|nr:hypothetical protein [Mucilaginibacter sp.]MDB5004396.1 hypothetical protein [Mucilaginibacter sp.]